MATHLDLKDGIESLTSFKRDTPSYLEKLRETGKPLVLTVNGKAEVVVQDVASYQRLLEIVDRLETLEAIEQGLREMSAGKGKPADQVLSQIRKKFKIPPR